MPFNAGILDTSIPLKGESGSDPTQMLQGNVQLVQGIQTLRQNQAQFGANKAISEAYSQSMNPDGTVDFNKLQSLAAQNGAGAYLPDFMEKISQQRNQQQSYDTSKLDMAIKQQQNIRGMIGSLAVDPDIGRGDMSKKIAGQIADAVQSGVLPLEQGVREIQSIPGEPNAQASWIQNHLINSLSGEAKLQALMPQGSTLNTGGQQVLLNRNPLTGQSTVAATIGNTLTPGESAQRIPTVLPNGQPGTVPLGSTVGGAAGNGYTGRPATQGAAGAPGGFLPTDLSPGEKTAQEAQGHTANAAAQALADNSSGAPMRINFLTSARDLLAGADGKPPLNTGPGSEWRNNAKSFINSLSPAAAKAAGWTGDIAGYDEFKKIMTNYSQGVSAGLGSGTDARLNAAITGNANPGISNMANQDIMTKTLAGEKMQAAQNYAFQNSGLPTNKFNQWQAQWNKSVNPETFAYVSMTPAQRQVFVDRVKKNGTYKKFANDLSTLVNSGVIEGPGK